MLWESPRASYTFCFSSITEQLFAAYILVSFLQHVVTFGSISAMLTPKPSLSTQGCTRTGPAAMWLSP